MGKRKPKAPKAPDYTALAKQQAELNRQAAQEQTVANRVDQYNPQGSLTWKQDPTSGRWTQTVSLSPEQQNLYDAQMGVQQGMAQTGQGLLGNAQNAVKDPFSLEGMTEVQGFDPSQLGSWGSVDFSGLNPMPDAGFGAVEQVRDAMMSRLAPDLQRGRDREIQRLKAQGLTEGTQAWNNAMQNLDRRQNDAEQQALLGAAGEYGNIFNRSLAGRQQGAKEQMLAAEFANALRRQQLGEQGVMRDASGQDRERQIREALMLRQMPLNELNAFMSGSQVQNPTFAGYQSASGYNPADIFGSSQMNYQAAMDKYNADMASRGNALGGLFSLGGAALGGMFGGLPGATFGSKLGGGLGGMFG